MTVFGQLSLPYSTNKIMEIRSFPLKLLPELCSDISIFVGDNMFSFWLKLGNSVHKYGVNILCKIKFKFEVKSVSFIWVRFGGNKWVKYKGSEQYWNDIPDNSRFRILSSIKNIIKYIVFYWIIFFFVKNKECWHLISSVFEDSVFCFSFLFLLFLSFEEIRSCWHAKMLSTTNKIKT